jgi:hypothetical protein
MLELIQKSYFIRVWPLQEIALAKKCLLLIDNYGSVGFEKLFFLGKKMKTLTAFDIRTSGFYMPRGVSKPKEHLVRKTYAHKTRIHEELRSCFRPRHNEQQPAGTLHQHPSVSRLLFEIRHLDAAEPRDKIFAIQGMLKLLSVELIAPDYKRSIEEVYLSATVAAMTFDQSFRVFAGLTGISAYNTPSWSPDWSVHDAISECTRWEGHAAGGTGRVHVKIDHQARELHSCGLQIGFVDRVHTSFPETAVLEKRGQLLRFLTDPLEIHPRDWDEKYLCFLELLFLELTKRDEDRSEMDLTYLATIERRLEMLSSAPSRWTVALLRKGRELEHDLTTYYAVRASLCRSLDRKKLFQTQKGHFGIAPMHIQEGDSLLLLENCNFPMVARREGKGWRLVAPAFVPEDGIMEGVLWREHDGDLEEFTFI